MSSKKVATVAVAVVAAVAAVISFEHMRLLAEAVGEGWRSWLTPLSVDGLLVASSLAARQAKESGKNVPGMTKLAIGIGIGISVAANVLSSVPAEELPAWLPGAIAAWPPLALALAFEEALRLRAVPAKEEEEQPVSEPAPVVLAPVPAETEPVEDVPTQLSDEEAREQARSLIRSGAALSGAALGTKFGRSDRWGRMQIAAVVAETSGPVAA